jgi:hypothetical protein
MLRTAAALLLLAALGLVEPARAAGEAPAPASAESAEPEDEDEDEEQDLRERLTEREDKRRPERSWTTQLGGRPLVISGELEMVPEWIRRRVIGPDVDAGPGNWDPVPQRDRLRLETGVEVEAFYSFGPELSLFGQLRLTSDRDLFNEVADEVSDLFLEPGEIWLNTQDVANTDLSFEIGRLDFEDGRRWWWDDELEAVRLAWEGEELEASLAFARRLLPERSDRSWIDPEEDRVSRLLGHVAWELADNHALEFFGIHHDDRSSTERVGEIVRDEREDGSDARLRWLGARAMGAFDLRPAAIAGYWIDLAALRGRERSVEYDDAAAPRRSEVLGVSHRGVRGSAFDAGTSLELASLAGAPRIFAGHSRATRDFRQPGIESNEAGFGGVERFRHYGMLLDPDLRDLGVVTLGAGLALLRASSLDLVYHRYRLRSLHARFIPDIELEGELEPGDRELGQEVDLVLALEEWERFEFELGLAAFRAGHAFDRRSRGETSLGAFVAGRLAF